MANVGTVVRTIRIRGESEGVEKVTGDLNKLAAAQQNVAVVSETSAKRVLSLEDAWKKQSLKLDEAARSQANISRETKIADGALREGLITQQQHAERLNLIAQRYSTVTKATNDNTKAVGLQRHEMINLGRQGADVFTQLASGQSLFLTAAQQGPQVLDVLATSQARVVDVVKSGVAWLGRFATSTAGVATGIGVIATAASYLAGAWQDSQREIERSLIGIGRRSGATVKDINEIARTSATATGLSVDQARDAALEFVKTGAIFKDNIKAAVAVTHDFAIVTGKDAKDAAKDLGAALASPLEGADALNSKLGFLDGRTREYIATLVSQNQKQEAQAVLLRNLAPAIQDATNTLGPFEKAWNAVANAASAAKNAIGSALTPRTVEQQRDTLVQGLNQRSGSSADAPPALAAQASRFNSGVNRRDFDEIERLNELLRETARATALAFKGDAKISLDADNAVRELLPYIDQLKKVEELISKIKAAQDSPGAQDRQGLAGNNAEAARAAEVLKMNIKAAADETARANVLALSLAAAYGTGSLEVAKTLAIQQAQLGVASAVGGAARLAAQEQATYTQLIIEGKSASDAAAIAAGQRAIAEAQINSNALETLQTMQNQRGVSEAMSGDEQIRAQAQATYNNLRMQGVAPGIASAVAAEQEAQARKRVTAEVYEQARLLDQQTDLIKARLNGTEATVKAEQAYENALRRGADAGAANEIRDATLRNERAKQMERAAAAAEREAAAWEQIRQENQRILEISKFVPFSVRDITDAVTGLSRAVGELFEGKQGLSQFNPEGYQFKTSGGVGSLAPNFDSAAAVNNLLAGGGSAWDAFNNLLSGSLMKVTQEQTAGSGPGQFGESFGRITTSLDTQALALIDRLRAMMPEEQRKQSITMEWQKLAELPGSLERDERMAQLIESLKSLTASTDSLKEAMTDVLSPFYSTDPRRTHLGFRAFAGGGIMTPWGELPLHKYDGGGIASSPQVSIFGEGSTPEAYIPAPNGQIPIAKVVGAPANSNQPPQIKIENHFHGPVTKETADMMKRTAFQNAQQMKRALG